MGEGNLTRIPLHQIQLDPDQPRTELRNAGITPESLHAHRRGEIDLSDPSDSERSRHFAALNELAFSIKRHKLIHPIGVYRDDGGTEDRYVIAEGERRFLAHLLLGEADIRAIVQPMPTRRKDRKARQLVENIVREDLSTAERVEALRHLDALHQEESGASLAAEELMEMLGISERQAETYLSVLHAPEDVVAAVLDKRITNLDKASAIAKLPSPAQRAKTILALEQGLTFPVARKLTVERGPSRGRPMVRVALGTTKKCKAVEVLMKGYLGEAQLTARYGNVDWTDVASVSQAWATFWNELEKSVR